MEKRGVGWGGNKSVRIYFRYGPDGGGMSIFYEKGISGWDIYDLRMMYVLYRSLLEKEYLLSLIF